MFKWRQARESGALTGLKAGEELVPAIEDGHHRRNVRDLMLESMHERFGANARRLPTDIQWLSDNGGCYSATETITFAETLGLTSCFRPPYSPRSNGMAESFIKGFKRDYVYVNELHDAASVMAQLPGWFYDYNHLRPHMSPMEYQQQAA